MRTFIFSRALTPVVRSMHIGRMKLSEFMEREGLDDEAMASRVRAFGVSCDRSTISRLRRGKVWLSKELAIAFRKATKRHVTADDFAA